MDYLTVKEMGEKWGISSRMVTFYCEEGRIKGALKKGNLWLVPKDASKPADGRRKKRRSSEKLKEYL
jgi:predicted site-specific integrase-resolvase